MAEVGGPTEHHVENQWLVVVIGVLCAVAGTIVLAKPAIALATLAVITGIFLLLDGIIELGMSLFGERDGGQVLAVILALASAIVGVLLVRHPLHGVVAIALLLGLWLIISAMIRFASTLNLEGHSAWNLAIVLIEFVAGVVIVASPGIGVRTLALLVGISFIVRGLGLCAVGWLLPRYLRTLGAPPSGAVTAT